MKTITHHLFAAAFLGTCMLFPQDAFSHNPSIVQKENDPLEIGNRVAENIADRYFG
jgi:hypothetical protein